MKLKYIVEEANNIATKMEEISHGCFRPSVNLLNLDRQYSWQGRNMEGSSIYKFRIIETNEYPSSIISYFIENISTKHPNSYFVYKEVKDLVDKESIFFETHEIGVVFYMGMHLFFCKIGEIRQQIQNEIPPIQNEIQAKELQIKITEQEIKDKEQETKEIEQEIKNKEQETKKIEQEIKYKQEIKDRQEIKEIEQELTIIENEPKELIPVTFWTLTGKIIEYHEKKRDTLSHQQQLTEKRLQLIEKTRILESTIQKSKEKKLQPIEGSHILESTPQHLREKKLQLIEISRVLKNTIQKLRDKVQNLRDEIQKLDMGIQSIHSRTQLLENCILYLDSLDDNFKKLQLAKIKKFNSLSSNYKKSPEKICDYIEFLLMESWYAFEFTKDIKIDFDEKDKILLVDYLLPSPKDIPNNHKKQTSKSAEWVCLTESKFNKIYDDIIYAIVIRTLAEVVHYDENNYIKSICFNGINRGHNPATGVLEDKTFLSIMVSKSQIADLDLKHIDPKLCFRHLKGVSASKLYEYVAVTPILTSKFHDRRIIDSKDIDISSTDNLAEMDWEDFEHLVRQIFEWEFSNSDSEVRVTQSSRDGGVDAIVFDPDPIRGGKIIIQAKRYTNTVPVSAVRDLYGTTINEGANKGILITTSDYGADSYKFAQGKNITLLNGGHILYLLNKHGKKAHINIEEAKRKQKE